ncbi:PLP-dependent aminotransferase family protein [Metabacillus halosaccharovorans]|uniref:aminotransferase-like domain-containing protein n=1 Tax=Metabacillus halosaccharovorans TaxID=930124 RepID=UPI001117AB1E|nr:PLP-dependent aminotransferase family protein [Metabacillus halosaccharovorans]
MNVKKTKDKQDYLFKQVYEYVLNHIERKEWKKDDKLPSVRSLADQLNVHRLTVLRAYQLLKQHNKVYVKDKSGYFVSSEQSVDPNNTDLPIISAYNQKNHLSDIHQHQVEYNFSQALIDPNLLPNQFLSDYVKKVFDLHPKVLATYSTVHGDAELRELLSLYFGKQYKTPLHKDDLLITSGSQQAIHLISEAFVKPRDTVLLERPSYSAAIDVFKARGANIATIDIAQNGYDLDQVERQMKLFKPRLFYLNPTFHNPTGITIPPEQRKQLVDLAEKYKCLLVEDDAYYDTYFDQPPPLPIYTYDTAGIVIYVRSFCKYISPGLRVASIICQSQATMKSLLSSKSLTDNGSPLLNQKIFLHYFSSLRLQQHLEKLRIALQIRKEIMEEELAATNWKWQSPEGGLNLWIELPNGVSTQELYTKAIEDGISFVPGMVFDPLEESTSFVRLSYSYVNEKQIREGIRRLVDITK